MFNRVLLYGQYNSILNILSDVNSDTFTDILMAGEGIR